MWRSTALQTDALPSRRSASAFPTPISSLSSLTCQFDLISFIHYSPARPYRHQSDHTLITIDQSSNNKFLKPPLPPIIT